MSVGRLLPHKGSEWHHNIKDNLMKIILCVIYTKALTVTDFTSTFAKGTILSTR